MNEKKSLELFKLKQEKLDLMRREKLSMLFNKKKKSTIIRPLNFIRSDTGKDRHFTPAAQEWYNNIYSYNNNNTKSLSVTDKNLMSIITGYFNLDMNYKLVKNQIKPSLTKRFKRLTTKRVFVGKGELKHTNNKVIITCYIYNTKANYITYNCNKLFKVLYKPTSRLSIYKSFDDKGEITIKSNRPYSLREYLSFEDQHKLVYNTTCVFFDNQFNLIINYLDSLNELVNNKVLSLDDKLIIFNNKILNFKINEEYNTNFKDYMQIAEKEYIKNWEMYKLLFNNNNILFTDKFSSSLLYFIRKMYNKKVELNVVNLNKKHLNSDIFTQIISLKLKNRENQLYKVLLASFRNTKIPEVNRIKEKIGKPNKDDFIVNKIRNNLITKMFIDNNFEDPLNNLLLDFYPAIDKLETVKKKRRSINKRSISLTKYVLRSLKHLKIRGIRIEAKGRLTKRFTAARSVFKLRWKGGLKNVDSSFRGLSAIMLRGFAKSNVEYSSIQSKNRNGAFGIKSWIGTK